jgi:prepilin peptidase CpaA
MTGSLAPVTLCFSVSLLLFAGLHDAAVRTIPNWIPTSLAVAGFALRIQQGNFIAGVAVAGLLLLILGVLWLRGFIGGGDMKLIPAVSLMLSPAGVAIFVLSAAIAGGVLSLIYRLMSCFVRRPGPGQRRGLLARVLKAEAWRMHRRGPLPYAVAIAAGALPILITTFSW